jgi:isoleucyl-tRNA synthetase
MNRERFWNEDSRAISILNDTLMKISVLMAPFSPLLTEHCYLNFLKKSTGATLESVHLFEYPRVEQDFLRYELLQSMELMCKTISNVRMLRNKLKIPIKQPLPLLSLTEKLYRDLEKSKLLEVISKEVNVLQISILSDEILESNTEYIFKSNYREIANIFKDKTPIIARYLEKNCDKRLYSAIQSENPTILEIEGESYMIEKNFVLLRRSLIKHKERYFIDSDGDTYYLDTTFDNELILMGALRHLLHRIQSTRKENGLQLSDRIKLSLSCDHEQFKELAKRKLSWIKKELLCKEIEFLSEGELPYGTEGAVVFSYREVQLSFCIVKEA